MTALVVAGAASGLALLALGPPRSSRPRRRLRGLAGAMPGAVQRAPHRSAASAALVGAVAMPAAMVTPPLGIAAVVASVAFRRMVRRRAARRGIDGRRSECVEVVHALAAELRAGRPPGAALAVVAEGSVWLREPLIAAATAVRNGADAASEMHRVAAVPGCAVFAAVAAAWSVTDRVGGPVANVLERMAAGLEADRLHRDSLDAALAGPRATTTLLAVLPLLGVALGRSMGADPVGLLLHRPLGWALLGAAALLEVAGFVWMGRITRSAMP